MPLTRNIILSIILIITFYIYSVVNTSSTLEQVHIFFRHGEKSFDPQFSYPNDPHSKNITDYSRRGQLTKEGKQMMLHLGSRLRNRYQKLIDDFYPTENIHAVEAISSHYPRSIMSLQLVLAGLFPPSTEEKIDSSLNWQPIPYSYMRKERDNIFLTLTSCPDYMKTLKTYVKSREFQDEVKQDKEIFAYISEKTGKLFEDYFEVTCLLDYLRKQEKLGLILPEWTKRIYPEMFHHMALKGYELLVATPQLKKMFTGHFLQKLIEDSNKVIISNKRKRMFLYSGHDINIMAFLKVLELYRTHFAGWGAMIIFEVHKLDQSYLKIFYSRNVTHKIELLKLPNCEHLCPLDKFTALTKKYMPGPTDCRLSSCDNGGFRVTAHESCLYFFLLLLSLLL